MSIKANQARKGQVLVIDGELFVITDFEHRKPGKGPAFNQIKCKHYKTGQQKQMRMSSDETLETAFLERRKCTFSYMEGERYVFMDNENYEQYFLEGDLCAGSMKFVRENQSITVTFYQDNPINLDLPGSVILQIKEAEQAVKGDSVTNDKKAATCETGLEIRVPMYIEAGEWVKVNTENGEFLSRAKEEDL
ncbi:MAG: elongation factor P [Planctomycetota bacterium]|jgi:elongation factor P|nr:elongation factor P [Planctomycetota bacterium]